jgi:hypothetical protein
MGVIGMSLKISLLRNRVSRHRQTNNDLKIGRIVGGSFPPMSLLRLYNS